MVSQVRQRFSSLSSDAGIKPDYTYSLDYDDKGNIQNAGCEDKEGNWDNILYSYDSLNQLVSTFSLSEGIHEINYDERGNIDSKRATMGIGNSLFESYTYSSGNPDLLTRYKSGSSELLDESATKIKDYTYDAVGNPTSIVTTDSGVTKTRNLTWEQGHQVKNITEGSTINNTYYYNESGLMAKVKKKDGSTIEYYYDDDQLEYEEYRNSNGTLTRIHKYFYDSDGLVRYLAVKTSNFQNSGNAKVYAYLYNGLGEITDLIYLAPTPTRAAHYSYSVYGTVTTTNYLDNIGALNPIRYKG